MTTRTLEHDTPLAVVKQPAPERVEVHFKPGITLSVEGITSLLEARRSLGQGGPHRVLILFPDEEVDFQMRMIITDHYEQIPQPNTEAVAWVARTTWNERFIRMYLSYWPPPFPSQVFMEEVEARGWLGW
jgi:hypothetical protein